MTTKKPENQPAQLTEDQLDDVSGALPAVQKVREAAARISTNATPTQTNPGNIVAGDGSV